SEPKAQANDPSVVVPCVSGQFPKIRCLAIAPFALETDVGRELASDLVTQAQSKFHSAQARSDHLFGIGLSAGIGFGFPGENQPVGQQHLVFGFDTQRGSPTVADIRGCLDFKKVGSQALNTECGPGARWSVAKVLTHTGDDIPPAQYWPSVQRFYSASLHAAVQRMPLAPEPQSVEVAADPANAFPTDLCAITCI